MKIERVKIDEHHMFPTTITIETKEDAIWILDCFHRVRMNLKLSYDRDEKVENVIEQLSKSLWGE